MRQELDGILVQMRTIRTALRSHLRDAEAQGNKDEQLAEMLKLGVTSLDQSLLHVENASYRAPSL